VTLRIQEIRVQRLYVQVAQQLRGLIADGSLRAGQRLPSERDLAVQFGVSRPTIREAMIALEVAGLVEVRSGSGVYVLEQRGSPAQVADSEPGPFEIIEARKLIEGETCALAAERITPAQLDELRALVREMADARHVEDAEQADQRFHCLIAEAAGNSALTAAVAWLWRLRNESEISTLFHRRVRAEGQRPIVADHEAILAALARGDGVAAREAMGRHLQRVIELLLEVA